MRWSGSPTGDAWILTRDERPFRAVPGAREVSAHQAFLRCEVVGPVGELMRLAATRGLVNVISHEPDLEQIFLSFTQGGASRAA